LEAYQQADYHCEQRQTFNKCGGNQHYRLNFTRSIGLTANGIHGAATDTTDTNACTQGNEASTNTGTHYSEVITVSGDSGNSLQEQREKHKFEKREKKKLKIS
jgi:FlaG/FlaF family flagellin (archaellin)